MKNTEYPIAYQSSQDNFMRKSKPCIQAEGNNFVQEKTSIQAERETIRPRAIA